MNLGFSDASISVVKRGMECRTQGILADHIGSEVCPKILRFCDDGYEMEVLSTAPHRGQLAMVTVFGKLVTQVWPRPPFQPEWLGGWLKPLYDWAKMAPWILPILPKLYWEEPPESYHYSLIHGDPALSNLMLRGDHTLIITDPMPRMEYRAEIPSLKEVDMGKLIQSAMGWERMLGCDAANSMWEDQEEVLRLIPETHQAKAMLWGAIHLARVAIRAPKKGRWKIAGWAEDASRRLVKEL